ncbi:MAG: hypothetical protein QM775_35055 [Pirellulales bacterium]
MRAAAWLLSRTLPDRYAERNAATVTPEQLSQTLNYFAVEMARQVTDAAVRRRLRTALRRIVEDAASGLTLPAKVRS